MLDSSVLVLNRNFQPVHVTNVRRAMGLLYVGLARAVDRSMETFDFASWSALGAEDGDDVLHTVSSVIRVPRVVALQLYDRVPRARVRFSRYNIYARDQDTCQYCGRHFTRAALNLDHVVPRSQGGRTTWENVVCCCVTCNLSKGGRTPEQAGLLLLRKPVRPRWTPAFRAPSGRVRYSEWLPFLRLVDAAYWNTELSD